MMSHPSSRGKVALRGYALRGLWGRRGLSMSQPSSCGRVALRGCALRGLWGQARAEHESTFFARQGRAARLRLAEDRPIGRVVFS